MDVSNHEPKNAGRLLGLRPDCGCCAGGVSSQGQEVHARQVRKT